MHRTVERVCLRIRWTEKLKRSALSVAEGEAAAAGIDSILSATATKLPNYLKRETPFLWPIQIRPAVPEGSSAATPSIKIRSTVRRFHWGFRTRRTVHSAEGGAQSYRSLLRNTSPAGADGGCEPSSEQKE